MQCAIGRVDMRARCGRVRLEMRRPAWFTDPTIRPSRRWRNAELQQRE
jgi:hypothetical protein